MDKKVISISHRMNGILYDDYTLYDDGTVLHQYDKHSYKGGQNLTDNLTVNDLSEVVKQTLIEAATNENREFVIKLLNL
jgi:hypothetical protein